MHRALNLILVQQACAVGPGNAGVICRARNIGDVVKCATILLHHNIRVGTAAVAVPRSDAACGVWASEMVAIILLNWHDLALSAWPKTREDFALRSDRIAAIDCAVSALHS